MTVLTLVKPEFGSPCNGCGHCCAAEVCAVGVKALGEHAKAPCPLMRFHDGRWWCAVVEEAERVDIASGAHMKWRMGIGIGCDADD